MSGQRRGTDRPVVTSPSSSDGSSAALNGSRVQLAALLEWHELMGITACLGDCAAPSYGFEAQPLLAPAPAAPPPALRHARPQPRATPPPPAPRAARPEPESVLSARALAASCSTIDELRVALESFEGCPLKTTATRLCLFDGNPQAEVMVIGEAPGAEEDREGRPFVGESGKLLDRMLAWVGLDRSGVYITNLLPWRPPGNRSPASAEIAVCQPFLERQVEILQPRRILFVGGISARALLGRNEGVTRLRGRPFVYTPAQGPPIPALVTFHPAYLLRQPLQKRFVWRDLLRLRRDLGQAAETGPSGPC